MGLDRQRAEACDVQMKALCGAQGMSQFPRPACL